MAISREDMLKKERDDRFVVNCRESLHVINVGRPCYNKLSLVFDVGLAKEMTEQEFLDCINYLQLADYIELRHIKTRESACIADFSYKELETRLSRRGVLLANGHIKDELIEY